MAVGKCKSLILQHLLKQTRSIKIGHLRIIVYVARKPIAEFNGAQFLFKYNFNDNINILFQFLYL